MPEGGSALVRGSGVPWPGEKRAARAAFPSGDLPEAPVGNGASLSRFAMARSNYFPPPPQAGRLCIAKQNSCPAPSSALLRPCGCKTVSASGKGIAVKAAMGAADLPARKAPAMSRDQNTFPFSDSDTDTELHTASATAHLLDELVLHGHRPGQDEPDPRPLPEPDAVRGQLEAMVEAFSAMLTATRLEDDLADVLWS